MNGTYQVATASPDDSQFYCCFGKCHVVKGAKIIAIIFAVNYVLGAVISLVSLAHGNPTNTGASLVGIIAVACLWYGLTKEREGFLIPFIIYMIICMILMGATLVALVVVVPIIFAGFDAIDEKEFGRRLQQSGTQENILAKNPSLLRPLLVLMLLILVISFSLSVLVFCTVKKAYSYIKQKRWSQSSNTYTFVSVPQMEQGYAPSAPKEHQPPPAYEETMHLEKK